MKLDNAGWLTRDSGHDPKIIRKPLPPFTIDPKTKRKYRKFSVGPNRQTKKLSNGCPMSVILHYTAGASGVKSAHRFYKAFNSVSSHIIVERDGTIIQCAPFGGISGLDREGRPIHDENNPPYVTHHAGLHKKDKPQTVSGPLGDVKFRYPNSISIGLDFAIWGMLKKRGDYFYCWPPSDTYRTRFNGDVFVDSHGGYWEAITEEAMASMVEIVKLIVDRFKIHPEYILEHRDVAPARKIDVGPALNKKQFIQRVYGEPRQVPISPTPVPSFETDGPLIKSEEVSPYLVEGELDTGMTFKYGANVRRDEPPAFAKILWFLAELLQKVFTAWTRKGS